MKKQAGIKLLKSLFFVYCLYIYIYHTPTYPLPSSSFTFLFFREAQAERTLLTHKKDWNEEKKEFVNASEKFKEENGNLWNQINEKVFF